MADNVDDGADVRRVAPLVCLTCGHEHYFESDDGGFDSAETIPWGACKTCACKAPNYRDARRVAPVEPLADVVCEHGTAMDVHCCNCHSGFIFDIDHECEEPVEDTVGAIVYPCGCRATGRLPLPALCPEHGRSSEVGEAQRIAAPPEGTLDLEAELLKLEERWDDRAEGWAEQAREASAGCRDDEKACMQTMNAINACINDVRALRVKVETLRAAAGVHPPKEPTA